MPKWAGASRCDAPAPHPARKGLVRASVPAPFLTPAERGRGQHSAPILPRGRELLFRSWGLIRPQQPYFLLCAAVIVMAAAPNIFCQQNEGQPKNETQISARRENFPANPRLPSLFLIGDSTVRNGQGAGSGGQWGWGDQIAPFFDTNKINIVNRALGGTTTRTYYRDFWARTLSLIRPGDFVLLQFGTNGGPINDAARARGELHGIGDETQDITNQVTKKFETVHTFGWYELKLIAEARAQGATPILCSLIPRNVWRDGKITRPASDSPAIWARDAGRAANAPFIDLNEIIARQYDALGQEKVNSLFVANAGPHTSLTGAQTNAICVISGLKSLPDNPLMKFFSAQALGVVAAGLKRPQPEPTAPPHPRLEIK